MQVPQFVLSAIGQVQGNGSDIWRFDSSTVAAKLENRSGSGNKVNYGVRTMNVAPDGKTLYLGMANPFNLDSQGGWELIEAKPKGLRRAQTSRGRPDNKTRTSQSDDRSSLLSGKGSGHHL